MIIAGNFGDDFLPIMEVEIDPTTGMPRKGCPPVAVAFGLHHRKDPNASKKAGHDVYVEDEYVKIAIPGDRNSFYFQPALDDHRQRFPNAYRAFKDKSLTPHQGTPIEQWAVISRSLALTMRACNIHTVEALAAVHDGHIAKFGFNARELRERAQAWLAEQKEGAASQKLVAEKQALRDELDGLKAQMAAILDRISPDERKRLEAQAQSVPVAAPKADNIEHDVAAAARRPRARAA
jgi:hypothetical protein